MNTPGFPDNGLTLVSLFAGCGGSSLGYKMAGYDVRLAVDWDPKAASTYRANFPGTPFWEGDVAALPGEEALRLANLGQGELDVLDGSPPCQGFSMAGKRRFSDARNSLFGEYVRLLLAFRPKAFIMENVNGLARGKMKLAFAAVTAALKGAGYSVSCRLLNAWWYGVPQDRRRLIWVGVRTDLGVPASHPPPVYRRPLSVNEALGLPLVETHPGYRDAEFRGGPAPTLSAGRVTRVMERHASQVVEAWQANAPHIGSFQSVRLDPSKPSPTQIGAHRNWAWDEPRYLTVGEAKTLQGFPGWFRVTEYRLIGNSVPPPMAGAVGRHVATLLKGGGSG